MPETKEKPVDKRTPEQIAEDKKNQEAVNNQPTPTEQAAEIIKAAVESKLVEISGTTYQRLETLTRYFNRQKIMVRGENWFKKEFDSLTSESLEKVIESRADQLDKQLAAQEEKDKQDMFKRLVSRGLSIEEAAKTVYGLKKDEKK